MVADIQFSSPAMLVKTATVTIHHPAILTLPSTPVPIVTAPANSYIYPLGSLWERDFTAADYTNVGTTSTLGLGSTLANGVSQGSLDWVNFDPQHIDNFGYFFQPFLQLGLTTPQITILPGGGYHDLVLFSVAAPTATNLDIGAFASLNKADWLGAQWRVECTNNLGNFTGGNAANKMIVTLIYITIPSFL